MKKVIIIGITVLLLGFGLMVAGMSMLDWDFWALDSNTYTTDEYVFSGDISEVSKIYVNIEDGIVKIVEGDELKIVYYEVEKDKTEITIENETLKFEQTHENPWNHFVFFRGLRKSQLANVIHVPKGLMLDIEISTHNAKIESLVSQSFKNVSLKTTNSSIRVKSLNASNLSLESTNGKLDVEKITAEVMTLKTSNSSASVKSSEINSLNVESTNGKLSIDNVKAVSEVYLKSTNKKISVNKLTADSVEISSTNGKINITNSNCSEIEASTTNDSIYAKALVAVDKLKLATTNDSITVTDIDSDSIYLNSTNGKVSGTIVGSRNDFNIDALTTNGKNNLSNYGSGNLGKSLYIRTTNGSIDISFSKN